MSASLETQPTLTNFYLEKRELGLHSELIGLSLMYHINKSKEL